MPHRTRGPRGYPAAITGVSGSGKSTLVNEVLYKAAARSLYRALARPGAHARFEGTELIDKVVVWCFTSRSLHNSQDGWKPVPLDRAPDPEPTPAPKSAPAR